MKIEKSAPEESKIYLNWIYGTSNTALQELRKLASNGNQQAAMGLLQIAETSLDGLLEICFKNPKIYEPIAREKLYWPAFVSELDEAKKKNEQLITMLNLGRDFGLNLSAKNLDAKETEIALMLFHHIKHFRKIGKTAQRTMLVMPAYSLPTKIDFKNSPWQAMAVLTEESRRRAQKLKPLARNNCKEWLEAAWPIFRAKFGDEFQDCKCFEKFIPIAQKIAGSSQKKIRGELRKYIKKRLLEAFKKIAPEVELETR